MEPSELTVAIMISELATIPLSDSNIPLLNGIVPVFVLSVIEIIVSIMVIKNLTVRKLITGKPVILVEKGKLKEDVLRSTRFTTDDLLAEMRLKGISSINDIEYGILETGGQVSFILNKEASPVTCKDIKKDVSEESLAFPVVSKGKLNTEVLNIIKRDEKWLTTGLKKLGYDDYKDLLLITASHYKIDFIQKWEGIK